MIRNGLLLLCIGIIVMTSLRIFIIYLGNKKKKIDHLTGFDLAKQITANYDDINIVESSNITISQYNLKRQIIRLTPQNYEKNDYFTLALSSILSGYSLAKVNKDNYLKMITSIIPSIDYLSKSPILTILISLLTNTIGDAKIGLVLLIIIAAYQYLMIQINTASNQYSMESLERILSDTERLDINKIQNSFLAAHTLAFITTLILIIREVLIILGM